MGAFTAPVTASPRTASPAPYPHRALPKVRHKNSAKQRCKPGTAATPGPTAVPPPRALRCTKSPPAGAAPSGPSAGLQQAESSNEGLGKAPRLMRVEAGSAPRQERSPQSAQTSGAAPGHAPGRWGRRGAGNVPFPWKTQHETRPREHPRALRCLPPLPWPPPSPCPLGKRRSVLPLPRPGVFENIYKDLIVERQNGISFPFTFQGSPNPSPLVQKHTGKGFLFCLIRFKGIFVWG